MAKNADSKLVALKAVPLFQGMSKKALAAVGRIADEVDLPAGRRSCFARTATRGECFILLDGEADVRRRGRKVDTLQSGDFFGEMSLLCRNRTATATVTAKTPVRVAVITRPNFSKLLRDAPKVERIVLRSLIERAPGDRVVAPT